MPLRGNNLKDIMEYIVIRCPSPLPGKPVNLVYYVVSRTRLSKCIDDYLDNKYEHTDEYAGIQIFKRLVYRHKGMMYKEAVRYCKRLNNYKNEDSKTKSRVMDTRGTSASYSSVR